MQHAADERVCSCCNLSTVLYSFVMSEVTDAQGQLRSRPHCSSWLICELASLLAPEFGVSRVDSGMDPSTPQEGASLANFVALVRVREPERTCEETGAMTANVFRFIFRLPLHSDRPLCARAQGFLPSVPNTWARLSVSSHLTPIA